MTGRIPGAFRSTALAVLAGDTSTWIGWPLFWAGMALATRAVTTALHGSSGARAPGRARLDHGTGGRPPVGAPD